MVHNQPVTEPRPDRGGALRRWLPVLVLIGLAALGYGLGLHHYVSLDALAANRQSLRQYVEGHQAVSVLLFMALYIAVVALSIPGAAVMSLAGGFLFGWAISVPATVIAATIGSVIVFQVVKTSFGAALAERASPFLQRLSRRCSENAFSLLLFLRLVPVFPFWAVNAVAGLSRVPLRSFVLATIIGIIPASFAFALIGTGLDHALGAQFAAYDSCVAAQGAAHCSLSLDVGALITRELVLGLVALGLVSLVPLAVKAWRRKPA